MEKPIIEINGLKKQYRLGQFGRGTLTQDLQSWWAKVRGKEDPNIKIGVDQSTVGQWFWALNGIDLCVEKGEKVGIIGGNGAGKSTLLKILSRITAPTEGEARLRGRVASMLEVGTGFNAAMTGRENIYMNGAILGMTTAEIDAKIESIIEFSECREFIDTPVKRYSSGMYVKLAFSVASHLDSDILIMDEVLAVGDLAFQQKCLDKMGALADGEGRTILYVSHNMNTIRQLCNRCIVLEEGRVVFDGEVEEAIEVYVGKSNELLCDIDLTNYERPDGKDKRTVELTRIVVEGYSAAIFNYAQPIPLRLCWRGHEELDQMVVRMLIRTPEGTQIGWAYANRGVAVKKNTLGTARLTLKLDGLKLGRYSADIHLICPNGKGPLIQDRVMGQFAFEIVDQENRLDYVKYHRSSSAKVNFPEFEVTMDSWTANKHATGSGGNQS